MDSICAAYAPGLLPGIDPNTDYPTTSDYAGGCYAQNGTVLVPSSGATSATCIGIFPRPGIPNVDMSLAKSFKVTEKLNVCSCGGGLQYLEPYQFRGNKL